MMTNETITVDVNANVAGNPDQLQSQEYTTLAAYMVETLADKGDGVVSLLHEAVVLDATNEAARTLLEGILNGFNPNNDMRELADKNKKSDDLNGFHRCHFHAYAKGFEKPEDHDFFSESPRAREAGPHIVLAQIYNEHAAIIMNKYNDHDAVVSLREKAVALSPMDDEYRFNLAHTYFDMDKFNEALPHLGTALQVLEGKMKPLLVKKGDQFFIPEENKKKMDVLTNKHTEVRGLAGIVLSQLGQHDAALQIMGSGARFSPDQSAFYNAYGRSLVATEQREKGISYLEMAISTGAGRNKARDEQYRDDLEAATGNRKTTGEQRMEKILSATRAPIEKVYPEYRYI